jgi:DNA gyrase subunit A
VFRLKAHEVPMASRQARGMAIVNLLQLAPDETIAAVIDTRDYETNRFLVFVTAGGQIKKTRFNEYDKSRRDGLIAINLREGDELVRVIPTNGEEVCLVTREGRLMRFDESEVRAMGRAAAGVRGIKLRGDDRVVAATAVAPGDTLLFVTDRGYGKRTPVDGFSAKHRGGQGVTGIKLSAEKGAVVACRVVGDDDEVLLVSSSGVLIRMRVDSISLQGAYATGVKVMALAESDRVAAVAPVLVSDEDLAADDEAAGDEVAASGAAPADEIVGDEAVDHADLDDADDAFDVDDTDEPPLA